MFFLQNPTFGPIFLLAIKAIKNPRYAIKRGDLFKNTI